MQLYENYKHIIASSQIDSHRHLSYTIMATQLDTIYLCPLGLLPWQQVGVVLKGAHKNNRRLLQFVQTETADQFSHGSSTPTANKYQRVLLSAIKGHSNDRPNARGDNNYACMPHANDMHNMF